MKIQIPGASSFYDALRLSDYLLNEIGTDEKYIFDFSKPTFFRPGYIAVVASAVRKLRLWYPEAKFEFQGFENNYLATCGFLNSLGVDSLRKTGGGSLNYLPIRFESIHNYKSASLDEVDAQIIDRKASDLARVVCRRDDKTSFDVLQYCFCEIIRNVVEHSDSSDIGIIAQFYPRLNEVEVVIIDQGVGLRDSLKNNPYLEINSHAHAIDYAVLPGISSKFYHGVPDDPGNYYQNSGWGIYMAHRIASLGSGGSFDIFSGDAGIKINHTGRSRLSGWHSGVVVRLVIKIESLESISRLLSRFRVEGELQAAKMHGANLRASKASKYFKNLNMPRRSEVGSSIFTFH